MTTYIRYPANGGGGGSGTITGIQSSGTGDSLANGTSGTNVVVKSLIAGTNVTITDNGDDLTIDATGGGSSGIQKFISAGRSTTLTPTLNTATIVTFDSVDINSGITLVSTSRFTVDYAGVYNIQVFFQAAHTGAGAGVLSTWFAKNNSAIAESKANIRITGNNGQTTCTHTHLFDLAVGDYIEVYVSTDDTISLVATGTQTSPTRPASPSVDVQMFLISNSANASGVNSVTGSNVDNTDPQNPIVNGLPSSTTGQVFQNQGSTVVATTILDDVAGNNSLDLDARVLYYDNGTVEAINYSPSGLILKDVNNVNGVVVTTTQREIVDIVGVLSIEGNNRNLFNASNVLAFEWANAIPVAPLGLQSTLQTIVGASNAGSGDIFVVESATSSNATFNTTNANTGPFHTFSGTDSTSTPQLMAQIRFTFDGADVPQKNEIFNNLATRYSWSWDSGSDFGTYLENKAMWFGNWATPITTSTGFINVGKENTYTDAISIYQFRADNEQKIVFYNSFDTADGVISLLEDNSLFAPQQRISGLNIGMIGDSGIGFFVNDQVWFRIDSGGSYFTDGNATDVFRININGQNEWYAASAFQTTVGSAGLASALPLLPREYLLVVTPSGQGAIPVYDAI
jgi:hypothetical protein